MLCYSAVFMFVGMQMTHRLKTHFIDEIYEEFGGILRKVTYTLSLMFFLAIVYLIMKSFDSLDKPAHHIAPGILLFFTFLFSNFIPTMLTPLTMMVFGYIHAQMNKN